MIAWVRSSLGLVIVLILTVLALSTSAQEEPLKVLSNRDEQFPAAAEGLWAVQLRFNAPVSPVDLARATQALVNDRKEDFELQDLGTDAKAVNDAFEFRLVSKKAAPEGATISVVVKKGLRDSSEKRALAGDHEIKFFAVLKKITVTGVSTFYRGPTDKGLMLQLSDNVAPGDLKNAVKITPGVSGLNVGGPEGWRTYRVTGDFELDRDYVLEVLPVRVNNGLAVLEAVKREFKGPGVRPRIALKSERSVVELRSRQLFPLSIENLTKVRANLVKIPAYVVPEYEAVKDTDSAGQDRWLDRKRNEVNALVKAGKLNPLFAGEFTRDVEVFFAPEAKDHVYGYSLPLSFRTKPEHGGAWLARFSDPDKAFSGEASRIIQITDLAVSYKLSAGTLLVWVTSIHTGEPVPGVELFISTNDRQRYFVGKTDKDGICVIKEGRDYPVVAAGEQAGGVSKGRINLNDVIWVVAATSSDSSAVEVSKARLKPFAVKQTKTPEAHPQAVRGQIFTERGIYLPGETVFFKFVMRRYKDDRTVAPADEKVKVEIVGPREDIVYSNSLTLGEFGSCHDSLALKTFFPVGTYTIRAQPVKKGAQQDTFTAEFRVQEYKRPRHLVTLAVKKEETVTGEYITLERRVEFLSVDVNAKYYTGGPVKHARARWKINLISITNKVEGMDGFFFGNDDTRERFLESGESILDAEGHLKLSVPLESRMMTGLYGVNISVTVLDIDGEPATEVVTYKPKPHFLVGISRHATRVQSGYSSTLKIVVVDAKGQKLSRGEVTASLMEKQYFYTLKRDDAGNLNYLWEEGWMKTVSSRRPIQNGEAQYDLMLGRPGEHMIAFSFEDKAGTYTSQTLFKVGWEEYEQRMTSRKEKGTPTSNEILPTMSKKEYKVGETVAVEFNTPRPVKKCLVALEKGDILEYRLLDIKDRKGAYQFIASIAHQPNVYVSILGSAGRQGYPVYPSQTDTDIPTVFFGYAEVRVRTDIKALSIDIEPGQSELKGRPGEKKALSFRVKDHKGKGVVAELAVCVVDEAVLALTRFATPDLSSLNDFNLALSVFSGDLRMELVSQDLFRILTTKPLTGGGEGAGIVSPSLRKDFRPVAYFNPALVTNESGEVRVEFQLPDTTTAYRVYAVGCDKGAGFASAQRNMVVTKEFFVEPSLPRFLIPGDLVTLPVVLNNQTGDAGEAFLEAKASKDLTVTLDRAAVKAPPHSITAVKARAEVKGDAREKGTFQFQGALTTRAGRFTDAIEHSVPVHSRYMAAQQVKIGSFTRQAEVTIVFPDALKRLGPQEMNTSDLKAHLSLSTTDWDKIAPSLKYLLHYPYGCIEQTSSGMIPLAGLRRIVDVVTIPDVTAADVDKFLQKGVNRLLSMQELGGGFTYWPGRLEMSWWGSLYATFALTMAKNAGYDVPADRLDLAAEYIRKNLFGEKKGSRHPEGPWTNELAVYTLAVNGKVTAAEMEPFLKKYDMVDNHGKALLLLAAKATRSLPDDEIARLIAKLDPQFDPQRTSYYNSSLRTIAFCLMAAVDAGVAPQKADAWAGHLIAALRPNGTWYSTADSGWCLLALSRYYRARGLAKPGTVPCKVLLEGEKPIDVAIGDASVQIELNPLTIVHRGKIVMESPQDHLVNYTLSVRYPDIMSGPDQLSKGLTLAKKVENLNGKEEIRVGDVLRVTLEIGIPKSSTGGRWGAVEYLALEDTVPAGLVPINSELQTEGRVKGAERTSEDAAWRSGFYDFRPTYSEFRDDGVRVFKNRAWTGNYRYTYLARATMEGSFWLRGSRLSLMYDPDAFARTEGRTFRVLPTAKEK